jgi:hypothetical protein
VKTRTVAIHQPNSFPWIGFFDKWATSDVFILLDDVQYPKSGGGWTNRCGVLNHGIKSWLTTPIQRNFTGTRLISEIELLDDKKWKFKSLSKLENYYKGAEFFDEVYSLIKECLLIDSNKLLSFNLDVLKILGNRFNLDDKKLFLSSNLKSSGAGTERLCSLVSSVGGTKYLSGVGSSGYQQDSLFASKGIVIEYQDIAFKPYRQMVTQEFVPGLSVIDAIMNIGIEGFSEEYLYRK